MLNLNNILKVLEKGSSEEKIKIIEELANTSDPQILKNMILQFDDDDIKVRGEVFSSLTLNKNKISDVLIENLSSTSKNIRGFVSLVLANREEDSAIPEIRKLVKDERSMVRACAIGSLTFMKDKSSMEMICEAISDSNLEVQKSAIYAAIKMDFEIPDKQLEKIKKEDSEMIELISKIKTKSGPEGI